MPACNIGHYILINLWSHLGGFFSPSWVPDLCCGRRVFPILHIDSNNFSDLPLGFVYICNSAYGGYDHHLIMRKIIIILSLIHSENVLKKQPEMHMSNRRGHNSGCRLCCRLCTEIFNSPRGLACFKWSCEKLQFLALKIFSLQRLLSTTYMQSQKAFHVPPIYHSFHFFLFSYSE